MGWLRLREEANDCARDSGEQHRTNDDDTDLTSSQLKGTADDSSDYDIAYQGENGVVDIEE